ncbi:MAG TPA: hypothetical protein VFU37_00675, partial [Pyrinomonadaceae bacterium]|nr:hypothetical protein [Pyrinomonadaceae bacterium]
EVAGEGLVLLVLISLPAELPGLCRGQNLDTENGSGVVRKIVILSVVSGYLPVVNSHYLAGFFRVPRNCRNDGNCGHVTTDTDN